MSDKPAGAHQPKVGKSLDEIAAIMAANTMARRRQSPNEGTDTDDATPARPAQARDVNRRNRDDAADQPVDDADGDEELDELDTGVDADESEDAEEAGTDPDESDDDELTEDDIEDEDPDGDEGKDDAFDEYEVDDDTLVQLDDETEVSLGDLKRAYAADTKAADLIRKREEAVQEAVVTRAKAQEEGQKLHAAAQAVFKQFEQIISQPLISKPDDRLKQSDPGRYVQHLEAYQQDQQRIQQSKESLLNAFQDFANNQEEIVKSRRQQEMQLLMDELPVLKHQDQKIRAQASQDILDAAAHYGFTPEEVNNAVDRRVYKMAYDAQQYRKIMSKSGKETENLIREAKTKIKNSSTQKKTLRSRANAEKNRLTAQSKRLVKLKSKAKTSGHVNDVAELIAAKRSKQGR